MLRSDAAYISVEVSDLYASLINQGPRADLQNHFDQRFNAHRQAAGEVIQKARRAGQQDIELTARSAQNYADMGIMADTDYKIYQATTQSTADESVIIECNPLEEWAESAKQSDLYDPAELISSLSSAYSQQAAQVLQSKGRSRMKLIEWYTIPLEVLRSRPLHGGELEQFIATNFQGINSLLDAVANQPETYPTINNLLDRYFQLICQAYTRPGTRDKILRRPLEVSLLALIDKLTQLRKTTIQHLGGGNQTRIEAVRASDRYRERLKILKFLGYGQKTFGEFSGSLIETKMYARSDRIAIMEMDGQLHEKQLHEKLLHTISLEQWAEAPQRLKVTFVTCLIGEMRKALLSEQAGTYQTKNLLLLSKLLKKLIDSRSAAKVTELPEDMDHIPQYILLNKNDPVYNTQWMIPFGPHTRKEVDSATVNLHDPTLMQELEEFFKTRVGSYVLYSMRKALVK